MTLTKRKLTTLASILLVAFIAIAVITVDFFIDIERNNVEWQDRKMVSVGNFGSVDAVDITPLVNWSSRNDALSTEAGVSYLIRTVDQTILFDAGFNRDEDRVSPLGRNIEALGIDPREIGTVFLSHLHRDHMGGASAESARRIEPGIDGFSLGGRRVFSPESLDMPDSAVTELVLPSAIGPGLATTGPIGRRLFIGQVNEQALVINVKRKGLVVIVGCGHQTVDKLVTRIHESFAQPIYAIVGDLHFPVPEGRLKIFGVDVQRRLASGDGPHAPMTMEDANSFLAWARQSGIRFVLGGHDTSDELLRRLTNDAAIEGQIAWVGETVSFGEGSPQ